MSRIKYPPYWTDDAIDHLIASHDVSVSEVEEVLYGIVGHPDYRIRRGGKFYEVRGRTGGGRYLLIAGEFLGDRSFRPF